MAEDRRGRDFRILGFHAEMLQPVFDGMLPFAECVAGRGTEDFGLRRGLQRGGRNGTAFLVMGAVPIANVIRVAGDDEPSDTAVR